jgi:MarR family transcriptional regulator, transcriptional regulator for hemolysin
MLTMNKLTEPTFGYLVSDLGRNLRMIFDRRAREVGLSLAQGRAIILLARHEGINQACLANLLEVQPISLARLMDRMEASGWIERRPDPNDRRAHCLYLTEKAHPVLEQIQTLAAAIREEAMAGVSAEEQATLMRLLNRVHANLSGGSKG